MSCLVLHVCMLFFHGLLPFAEDNAQAAIQPNPVRYSQSQAKWQGGRLAGYVMSDTGQPLANSQITITRVGKVGPLSSLTIAADAQGGFQFTNIPSGAYTVSARVPGYIRADGPSERRYYRPGDLIVLTMLKGGVITGTVRNHQGEPLINVPVRAFRIRDLEGKPASGSVSFASRLTDDRGIYRLYGLAPGAYLVCAGGGSRSFSGYNKYEREAVNYYPSSTRETAEKVMVQLGQEISSIDITYRSEEGHVVSGTIGGTGISRTGLSATVALTDWATGEVRNIGYTMQDGAFAFYGVPDGEYFLIAQCSPADEKEKAISQPYRIKVAGVDVTGVKLALSPLGSVSGQIVLEPLPKGSLEKCGQKQRVVVEEAVVTLQRERVKNEPVRLWETFNVIGAPDEKGLFTIHAIGSGQYGVNAALPGEAWFVKSAAIMKEPAANPKGGTISPPMYPMLDNISIQSGTQIQLTVTLAEGAARFSGRVILPEGKTSSDGMVVHLVPAEQNYTNNPLRFFRTDAQANGAFSFTNIAPGKYKIFARSIARGPGDIPSLEPSPWNVQGRAILHREVQKSNIVIELSPCQSVQNYVVKYKMDD